MRIITLATLMIGIAVHAHAELIAFPTGPNSIEIVRNDTSSIKFTIDGWGSDWKRLHFKGWTKKRGEEIRLRSKSTINETGAKVSLESMIRKTGERELAFVTTVSTNKDTASTHIVLVMHIPQEPLAERYIRATSMSGSTKTIQLPLGKRPIGNQIKQVSLADRQGEQISLTLSPPSDVSADGALRIVLVDSPLKRNETRKLMVTISLNSEVTLYARTNDLPVEQMKSWYRFKPGKDLSNATEIGMEDWLDAPAGKYGRIVRDGSFLMYNGKPIKLWGINTYTDCAPHRRLARRRAKFYARFGINAVRLHKYAQGLCGIQSLDSFAEYDRAGLNRMDYQVAKFKEAGIYVKLSPHFGNIKLRPADRRDVPYLKEFGKFNRKFQLATPHSAFFYSPELQNLQIRQMINLLKHKNPYTGLTYAEDPVIFAIEIINEQSILFYTSMGPLKRSPTLRQRVGQRFSRWLKQKYGSHDALVRSWGKAAFDSFEKEGFPPSGESLDKENILPLGNPWFWDPNQLNGSQSFRKQRLLDSLEFLYELQVEAYERYVAAVRNAGYKGEIIGSNWQAGRAFSHYANLHTDYRVGLIDRHNYFGGTPRNSTRINNESMLHVAGSGILSSGLQQVADRPFMLSEWNHVYPNEWGVEGPAIVGAYGLGLQGWDTSFIFGNKDFGYFNNFIGESRWEVTIPQILGIFPAVSRQVHRGDIRESDEQAVRYIHLPSLFKGRLGFNDKLVQGYDDKILDSSKVSARTLAVARAVVEFTDSWQETPIFNLKPYTEDGALISSTKQLTWAEGKNSRNSGFFTINTPGTQAAIGFVQNRKLKLNDVIIQSGNHFSAVYLTAKERDGSLAHSRAILITAIARARNTGMKIFRGIHLLEQGRPPILMEPVRMTITLLRQGNPTIYILDQEGRKTGDTVAARNGILEIDTGQHKTPYFSIEY